MSFQWHEIRDHLMHSSSTFTFQRSFDAIRRTQGPLADFRDPSDGLTKYLCRDSATGTQTFGTQALSDHDNDPNTPAIPTGAYNQCGTSTTVATIAPFEERFYGNSWKPRVTAGIGVNWNSPFGPFRIDLAYALLDPRIRT